jgi:hypothetical protein
VVTPSSSMHLFVLLVLYNLFLMVSVSRGIAISISS